MQYKNIYPTPSEYTYGTNTCEYIVLHHTGTKEWTTQGVLNGLNKYQDYASCHYLVSENWDVYKMWNDTDILWHAGTSTWDGKSNMNNYSIGIEIIWPLSNWGFTDEQRESVSQLVKELAETHDIPSKNVIRHLDISPWRKWDVSDTFWNVVYKSYNEFIKSIFQEQWEYRKLAWESVINNPDNLIKTIRTGTPDEAVAAIEIICDRRLK